MSYNTELGANNTELQEILDTINELPQAGTGGVISWNDLEDKPFGEIGGDTLIWDGTYNPDEIIGGTFVRISDAVPTASDLANGVTIKFTTIDGEDEIIFSGEELSEFIQEDGFVPVEVLAIIPYDNYEVDSIVFPKAGTYTVIELLNLTITIPNYKGFVTVKKIDKKYLPEAGITEDEKNEIVERLKNIFVEKNQGAENVGKILAVGTDGNLVLVDMPEGGASGDVIGTIDESNNILLTGKLADGTYTLKYENDDGSYTDIGTLTVGEIANYTNLADPTSADWKAGYRLNSSGAVVSYENTIVTNFIPCKEGDIVRIKGLNLMESMGGYACGYDDSGTKVVDSVKFATNAECITKISDYEYEYTAFTAGGGVQHPSASLATKIRFSGALESTANAVIITVNQEIV